jgi:hypothetical protein
MAKTQVAKQIEYLNPGNLDGSRGPYASVADACLAIPSVVVGGRNLREGKIVDVGLPGAEVEHRWVGGFEDAHLIDSISDLKKTVSNTSNQIFDISDDGEILILDSYGNIAHKIDVQGNSHVFKLFLSQIALGKSIEFFETEDYEFIIEDSYHNILVSVESGNASLNANIESVQMMKAQIASFQAQINNKMDKVAGIEFFATEEYEFIHVDSYGNILYKIEKGETEFKGNFGLPNPSKSLYQPISGQLFDIEYTPLYGQSLSIGTNGTPVLTSAQRYSNLMFKGGIRFWDGPGNSQDLSGMIPAIENLSSNNTNLGETAISAAMNMFVQRITEVKGVTHNAPNYDYALLGGTPGFGGKSISELSKGSIYYTRFIDSVTAGKAIAQAQGKTFGLRCIYWVQGDNDAGSTAATYSAALKKLRLDLNADIKAIIGVNQPDIPIIMYQFCQHNWYNANPTIGLAQLELAKTEPGFFISNPGYFLEYSGDNRHYSNYGNLHQGVYLGKAAFEHLIQGNTPSPFVAQSYKVFGNIVEVVFNPPSGKLSFDTSMVPAKTNMGFGIVAASGSSAISITSVAITRPDTIRFVLSRSIASGDKLTYAQNGTKGSTAINDQAKGNLRDTYGDNIVYNPSGDNYKVHNWALMHELTFNI